MLPQLSLVKSLTDVTNIDSVGVVTARGGLEVTGIITARPPAVTFKGGVEVKDAQRLLAQDQPQHLHHLL